MGRADFTHEIEIRTSRAQLHAFLCDLHNYVPLHPLILSIEDLPPVPEMPGSRRYRVVDRVPFGPFQLRARYVAAIEPVSDHEIRGHAWQSPRIHLETAYALNECGAKLRLVERVSVEAPWLLRRFVATQASRAHQETLAKLKTLFEGGRGSSGS
jgi:hypothetical protein